MIDKKDLGIAVLVFLVGMIAIVTSCFVHEAGHVISAWILGAEIDWENWIEIYRGYFAAGGIGSGLSPGEDQIMKLGGGLFAFLVYLPIPALIWKTRRIPERNLFAIALLLTPVLQLICGILESFFPRIYSFLLEISILMTGN